jgi:hypothetical protein
MITEKEYKRVNWAGGIDVGLEMFEQTENFFTSAICDASALQLNKNNFGLLPSTDGKRSSSEFDISERVTGTVEIKLRSCNAITAGGCRININPSYNEPMMYSHTFEKPSQSDTSQTAYWDVVITADPYRRIPTGVPKVTETPLRHPDVDSFYGISVIPTGEVSTELLGMYHLVIGRIRYFGERYTVDTGFIPPCTSMAAHSDLARYYELFGRLMNDIENRSKTIIAKIRNRSQNSPVANNVGALCEEIMRYIASVYFNYRNTGLDATPVGIVNYFSTLAHICYIGLAFIGKAEREELLRYFYEWSDVKPGAFEEMLSSMLSLSYNHNNIKAAMLQVEIFLQTIADLWLKLSTLEYIGQHKENIVIGERNLYTPEPANKSSWTILD